MMITNVIKNLFKIGKLLTCDDAENYRAGNVHFLGKDQRIRIFSPYGLQHNPPVDSMVIVFNQQAQESNAIGIADHPNIRTLKDMQPGEVALGNYITDHYLYFDENGKATLVTKDIDVLVDDTTHLKTTDLNVEVSDATTIQTNSLTATVAEDCTLTAENVDVSVDDTTSITTADLEIDVSGDTTVQSGTLTGTITGDCTLSCANLTVTASAAVGITAGAAMTLGATGALTLSGATIAMSGAGASMGMSGGNMNITSSGLQHNSTNIGSTHIHSQGNDSYGNTEQDTGAPHS